MTIKTAISTQLQTFGLMIDYSREIDILCSWMFKLTKNMYEALSNSSLFPRWKGLDKESTPGSKQPLRPAADPYFNIHPRIK